MGRSPELDAVSSNHRIKYCHLTPVQNMILICVTNTEDKAVPLISTLQRRREDGPRGRSVRLRAQRGSGFRFIALLPSCPAASVGTLLP